MSTRTVRTSPSIRVKADEYSSAGMYAARPGPQHVEPFRRYVTRSQQAHVVDETVGSGAWVRRLIQRTIVRQPSASTWLDMLAATIAAASYSLMLL